MQGRTGTRDAPRAGPRGSAGLSPLRLQQNGRNPAGTRCYQAEPRNPIEQPPKTHFSAFSVISAVENNCTQSPTTGNL